MKLVAVPNDLRDELQRRIDVALAGRPCPDVERHEIYRYLLSYYDEHGEIPNFSLEARTGAMSSTRLTREEREQFAHEIKVAESHIGKGADVLARALRLQRERIAGELERMARAEDDRSGGGTFSSHTYAPQLRELARRLAREGEGHVVANATQTFVETGLGRTGVVKLSEESLDDLLHEIAEANDE